MGGGGAWIRGRQPTGGSGPVDLGGVQWVGLGSGREGSSAQAASGRGGRDRAKGGAAAVLPGVGGLPLLLPYLPHTAPHALRDLRLTRRFAGEASQFILPFTEASEGAPQSLWDTEMSCGSLS